MTRRVARLRLLLVFAIALPLLTASAASAGFIFDGLVPPPDIATTNVQVDYVAATDSFIASGVPGQLNDGVNTPIIFLGEFDLLASISASGVLSSGSLVISGVVAGGAFGTLLTADVVDVGFSDVGGDPLQFLLSITGGELAGLYPTEAGVVISGSGFTGFGADFSNNGSGVADTAPIPEPSTAALLAVGLTAFCAVRSRARRR
jgi:hypothetical protein